MTLPLVSARVGRRLGWSLAGLLFALCGLAPAHPARAQAEADPYSAAVKVDATADNSVDARRMARRDGEHRALAKVVAQVSGSSDVALPKLDDNAVTDMVKSFEVAHERMSAVRYLADYTFHFYPDKVRRLLRKAGLAPRPVTTPAAAPAAAAAGTGAIVVLPVYEDGANAVLWDDPNPWREAWAQRPGDQGSVQLIVPLGDAEDLAAIDAERAEAGRPDALAAIARRNRGNEVVVALAQPRRQSDTLAGLAVTLSAYRGGRLAERRSESIAALPGEDEAALLRRAVAATADAIAEAQTASAAPTPPSPARGGGGSEAAQTSLAAVVPIASLGDWIAVRRRLASVPAIRGIDLLSLSREEARVRLRYTGNPDRLKADLAAADLALDGGDPVWHLRPAGPP